MIAQYPELLMLTWIDERRRVTASYAAPSLAGPGAHKGEVLRRARPSHVQPGARPAAAGVFAAGRRARQLGLLQLHVPLAEQGKFGGVILGEYSIDGLLRYGVPAEVSAKYAVALLDGKAACWPAPRCRRAIPPPSSCLGGPAERVRSAGLAGGQRPDHPRAGLSHRPG